MKRYLQKLFPSSYDVLRDFQWDVREQLSTSLKKQHPVKRTEVFIRKLASHSRLEEASHDGFNILFFTVRGWPYHVAIDAILALRLHQKGHHVEFLDCMRELDNALCHVGDIHALEKYKAPCAHCNKVKNNYYRQWFPSTSLGVASKQAQNILPKLETLDLEGCRRFEYAGLSLGSIAELSVIWYLCRAQIGDADVPLFRRALRTAILVADRFPVHLERTEPDCVVMLNGSFVAEAVARKICEEKGIRYVTHEVGPIPGTLYVAVNDRNTYSVSDTFKSVAHTPLTPQQENKAQQVFNTWRRKGEAKTPTPGDHDVVQQDEESTKRPMAVAFPNMTFDSAAVGRETVFSGVLDWMLKTILYFTKHPEWQLIIRCHPAESNLTRRSLDRIEDGIAEKYPALPQNIRLIGSGENADSYALMDAATCGLAYTSTTGLEMIAMGKPVIIAGQARYAGLGFTEEPASQEEYFSRLKTFLTQPVNVDPLHRELLLRYMYHYYFERMVPFEPISLRRMDRAPIPRRWTHRRLATGRLKGVEAICGAITRGTPAMVGRINLLDADG